jgi:hypothetical protein
VRGADSVRRDSYINISSFVFLGKGGLPLEPSRSVVPRRGQSVQIFYKRFGVIGGFAIS